jgi:DnaJ-class molecular chaperone
MIIQDNNYNPEDWRTCPYCDGDGLVVYKREDWDDCYNHPPGWYYEDCHQCKGTGEVFMPLASEAEMWANCLEHEQD